MSDPNNLDENGIPYNAVPMTKEELYSISAKVAIMDLGVHQLRADLSKIGNLDQAKHAIEALLKAYEMENRYAMRLIAAHVITLNVNIEELRTAVKEEGKKFGEAMKDYAAAMKAASAAGGGSGESGGTLH